MTNMTDIKNRKQEFNDHCGDHKCRAGECSERKRLWLVYMKTSEQWKDHTSADTKLM
jgi:hypothetical protein